MPRTVSAFISYRRKEAYNVETNFIDRLVEALTAMGVDVFIDRDITPGDDYHARLFREIRDRDLFIPLLGADWLTLAQEREAAGERDVVQQEIKAALDLEKEIVPIILDGAAWPEPEDLPEAIRILHYQNGRPLTSDAAASDIQAVFGPAINRVSSERRMGPRWLTGYWIVSVLAYLATTIVPHSLGIAEYGLDAWIGMATVWSGLFIWPIFFLPFAMRALYRPFRILIEGIMNADRLTDRVKYTLPLVLGVFVAILALAIEIQTVHQAPWTVHPVFAGTTCPPTGRMAPLSARPADPRLAGVVRYDADGAALRSYDDSVEPAPVWLTDKCWPNAFFYLTKDLPASEAVAADRARVQRQFVETMLSANMGRNAVPFSLTFYSYVVSFTVLILLGTLGISMAIFFVAVQIKRRRDQAILKLPSEDAYLWLTYAFISLMFWVPFRMITVATKARYYCPDLSQCVMRPDNYLNDLTIGIVFIIGYLALLGGLMFKHGRQNLAWLGAVVVVGLVAAGFVVMRYSDTVAALAVYWQSYVALCIVSTFILALLAWLFDPATVRFNDFSRGSRRLASGRAPR